MPRREYVPPEFDPSGWAELGIHQLARDSNLTLTPESAIGGVGGFNDLNTIQKVAIRSLFVASFDGRPTRRQTEDLPAFVAGGEVQAGRPLASVLRPKGFSGNIAGGRAYILPFDLERVVANTNTNLKRPYGMVVYLAGTLASSGSRPSGSREDNPPQFELEIDYLLGKTGMVQRYIGPTDSLRAAAGGIARGTQLSPLVGELTTTIADIAMHPQRTDRPPIQERVHKRNIPL